MSWTADNAKANGRGDKREKRTEYTKLDMSPWIRTAVGCKQTKHWNIYTKCTDCNAARWTPPLTKLPGTHDATDWKAECKALEAQKTHDKPSDRKEPIVVDAPQDIASDTDTDSEDEIGMQLAKELEGVIAQFTKMGQTTPQLEGVKQLVKIDSLMKAEEVNRGGSKTPLDPERGQRINVRVGRIGRIGRVSGSGGQCSKFCVGLSYACVLLFCSDSI